MTRFEKEYFQTFKFSPGQIKRFLHSALRDFKIAREDAFKEVRFNYCYQALLKGGIALLAQKGAKVRSIPGHHIKVLEKMSEILDDPDIFTIGNAMRMKRNQDFYGGGEFISEKEIEDYLGFVEKAMAKIKSSISP